MDKELLARYNDTRSIADKAVPSLCYAPHVNMFFDQTGEVRACCWNSKYNLGNVLRESIDEIWQGARTQALRNALEAMEFGPGCIACERQTANGWIANPPMRTFDRFPLKTAVPEWPQRMEFSISNACNLECIMCNGTLSSSIRARREHLPPRPMVYPESFFDSLRKFLPHLQRAKFLGGEPFLVREYYKIWDMMIADGIQTDLHVTTNGTQYTSKVERVLGSLRFHLAVSLDGATKKTVESIRVNANYEQQIANLQIFRSYTREKKTDLSLTFCFMRQNWFEFGDYCLFGEELGCRVSVNTVNNPPQSAVNNLPAEELRKILDAMESESAKIEPRLKLNRGVWLNEVERVRTFYRSAESKKDRNTPPELVVIA